MDDKTKIILTTLGSLVVGIFIYWMNRQSKKRDDQCGDIKVDVNKLIDLIKETGSLVVAHQSGAIGKLSYTRSRENVTAKRKEASQMQGVIEKQLASQQHQNEFKLQHVVWLNALMGDSGLISEHKYVWNNAEIKSLEDVTEQYLTWLTSLRSRITLGAVKTLMK